MFVIKGSIILALFDVGVAALFPPIYRGQTLIDCLEIWNLKAKLLMCVKFFVKLSVHCLAILLKMMIAADHCFQFLTIKGKSLKFPKFLIGVSIIFNSRCLVPEYKVWEPLVQIKKWYYKFNPCYFSCPFLSLVNVLQLLTFSNLELLYSSQIRLKNLVNFILL